MTKDKELAEYYSLSLKSVSNYKGNKLNRRRLYDAMHVGYNMPNIHENMTEDEIIQAKRYYMLRANEIIEKIEQIDSLYFKKVEN
jgi:hypothetical protein